MTPLCWDFVIHELEVGHAKIYFQYTKFDMFIFTRSKFMKLVSYIQQTRLPVGVARSGFISLRRELYFLLAR